MKIPRIKPVRAVNIAVTAVKNGNHTLTRAAKYTIKHEKDRAISAVLAASALAPCFYSRISKIATPEKTNYNVINRSAARAISKALKKAKPPVPASAKDAKLMVETDKYSYELNSSFNNLLLQNEKKRNPMHNKAHVFVSKSKQYGVNPVVLMAIAMHESARGTSSAAKLKHNVGGVMGAKSLRHYSNVDSCIEDMAQIVSKHHSESHVNTVAELASSGKYCDKSVAKEWAENVLYYMKVLLN